MSLINKIKNIIKKSNFLLKLLSPLSKFKYYIFYFYLRNKKFKKNGEYVLLKAKKALDSIDLFFWLDYGTLLGAYRDGKFISNDLDIDIGLFFSDYSPKIKEAMENHGFRLVCQYEIDNGKSGLEQTYKLKGVTVDMFFYIFDDDKMCSHVFVEFPGLTYSESIIQKGGLRPIRIYMLKTKFSKFKFLNKQFSVPFPTHDYLAYHYGDDYKIPRKWYYWDLKNDNKNAKYIDDKIGVVIKYK